jgi:spermidine/putrescine transport system substrate-binding protein
MAFSIKRRYVKVLFFAVFLSFVWGLYWGYYQDYKARPESWAKGELHILAEAGRFDPAFVEKFSRAEKIILRVTEKETPQELLRELLSHHQDYDLVQFSSFLADSFLLENLLEEIDDTRFRNAKNISIDFKNLSFDPENRFLIPLFWGVNGYVYNSEALPAPDSLTDILNNPTLRPKVALMASPVELYTLATQFRPIIKTWVNTGNQQGVNQELKAVKEKLGPIRQLPLEELKKKDLIAAQIANGDAAVFLQENSQFKYFVPVERANLWVGVIGIMKESRKKKFAEQAINRLLSDEWNSQLIKSSNEATVLASLNSDHTLLPLQKAQFVREIRLSRFQLFYDREAYEPLWSASIKEVVPELWKFIKTSVVEE